MSGPCPSATSCEAFISSAALMSALGSRVDVFPLSQSMFNSSHQNNPDRLTWKSQGFAGPLPLGLHKAGPVS